MMKFQNGASLIFCPVRKLKEVQPGTVSMKRSRLRHCPVHATGFVNWTMELTLHTLLVMLKELWRFEVPQTWRVVTGGHSLWMQRLPGEPRAETDFGQTDFGHPYFPTLAKSDFGQIDCGQFLGFSVLPRREPRRVEPRWVP